MECGLYDLMTLVGFRDYLMKTAYSEMFLRKIQKNLGFFFSDNASLFEFACR